ncbi:rhomboid family intramembrane serine protease [Spiroplasma apis]|uniref:Putative rhomboid-like transmembrane protein n=1 Tax=Spiroplasma apis B31 TaxID=1276258 RepID=V5RJ47_SPIAP|nr:rhomboid family intramembrane serine protease [Spiroplasma apis]AHB36574.1 putative rhomboid-like transmembrane protein [Spiroplasma apis B31]
MNANLSELKLNLVHFLIKVEKYKALPKYSNENISYLVNPKNKFQIVCVTIGNPVTSDKNLEEIKNTVKSAKREKLNTLIIALTSNLEISLVDGTLIDVDSLETIKTKLSNHFPRINSLVIEKNEDSPEIDEEELLASLKNPSESSNIKLKNLAARMTTNSALSILLGAMFIILPIVTYIMWTMLNMRNPNTPLKSDAVASLFFGATNRSLTVIGQQYWRIFTYGFTANNGGLLKAIIEVFIIGSLTLKLSKYTEGVLGTLKFASITLITYVLAGLFVSVMIPFGQFNGVLGFTASTIAALGVTTWDKKNDTVIIFSKNRIIMPLLIMIAYSLFFKTTNEIILIVTASGISGALTMLMTYNYKNLDRYFVMPVVMIAGFVIIPIIFLFLPYSSLAEDRDSINAMGAYIQYNTFSVEQANRFLGLNKWRLYFNANGNLVRF